MFFMARHAAATFAAREGRTSTTSTRSKCIIRTITAGGPLSDAGRESITAV
jgi:hypothetical protein